MNFHEVRFPSDISLGATGGPERRTDVVVLGSGFEERNARWADSRRAYNAGYGIRGLPDLYTVIAFFEERRGKLYGFRWRDPMDWTSAAPEVSPSPFDQQIGVGDGATAEFQLIKSYGSAYAPWAREIRKPVEATVVVAVGGIEQTAGTAYTADSTDGVVRFLPGYVPEVGAVITAGFAFDVPVRFDTDKLEVNLRGFQHGAIPAIPIVEVRL